MSKRTAPEVNAGSMADIAFLLLIFFLVTTTIDKDEGINRRLPKKHNIKTFEAHERNVFEIRIGENGDLFVENNLLPLPQLAEEVISFLDNGGIPKGEDGHCNYCLGKQDPFSSVNPQKAILSLTTDRDTSYELYIQVQNELNKAYNMLRNRESQRLFGYNYTEKKRALDQGFILENTSKTKEELKQIRDLYPMLISEAEIKAVY